MLELIFVLSLAALGVFGAAGGAAAAARDVYRLAPLTNQDDKISHFTVSATGTAAIIKLFQVMEPDRVIRPEARIGAGLIMLMVGIAKETFDIKRGGRNAERGSAGDLAADGAGIAFGQVLEWEF